MLWPGLEVVFAIFVTSRGIVYGKKRGFYYRITLKEHIITMLYKATKKRRGKNEGDEEGREETDRSKKSYRGVLMPLTIALPDVRKGYILDQ